MNQNTQICQVKGRLCKDPEYKLTPSGKKVLTFNLAYNTAQKTDDAGSHTNFIQVEAWERLAEIFSPLLVKGIEVLVNGSIIQNRWKNEEGKGKAYHKISADAIYITDLKFKTSKIEAGVETA